MAIIIPVVLCGGSGMHLWPLSRKSFPKQFVPLVGSNYIVGRHEVMGSAVVRKLLASGPPAILPTAWLRTRAKFWVSRTSRRCTPSSQARRPTKRASRPPRRRHPFLNAEYKAPRSEIDDARVKVCQALQAVVSSRQSDLGNDR